MIHVFKFKTMTNLVIVKNKANTEQMESLKIFFILNESKVNMVTCFYCPTFHCSVADHL